MNQTHAVRVGALLLLSAAGVFADTADFSGHWQVDPAKSKFGEEKTLSLDIQQQGNQITFERKFEHDGKPGESKFTCVVGGQQCDFDDNGHKAKVTLWYNGPALVVMKTDGDKHDSTVKWHLQLQNNGNTLMSDREVMEPTYATENLVFDKSQNNASR